MYKLTIKKYIFLAVGIISLLSLLVFFTQSYNQYAYVLTKGNFPFVRMLLEKDLANDSWDPMHIASDHWDEHQNSRPIYTENLIQKNIRFQYLPSTLFIPQFIKKFNIDKRLFYDASTYIFILINGFLVFKIFRSLAAHNADMKYQHELDPWSLVGILALTVLYFPILQAGVLGNIQIWLNALFALSLVCMINHKHVFTGICMGIASTIKPQFGLLLIWAIFRKNWGFVLGFIPTFALIVICGIAAFGLENHFDYLNALAHLSEHGESYHHNQSMNGLLNRIFSVNNPDDYANLGREYLYQPFPPFNPWVYYPTLMTSLMIIGLCLAFKTTTNHDAILVDYSLMSVGLTLASPVTWIYHYGILLPISAVILWIFQQKLNPSHQNRKLFQFFAVCFLITGLSIPFVEYVYHTHLNVTQSYYYFASLGIFAVLYQMRRQLSDAS